MAGWIALNEVVQASSSTKTTAIVNEAQRTSVITCPDASFPISLLPTMHVGVCRTVLRMQGVHSLKGKRGIIGSLRARVRNKYNVSIAEISDNDSWQTATLGMTSVSNDPVVSEKMLAAVLDFIERGRDGIEIVECEREVISGF